MKYNDRVRLCKAPIEVLFLLVNFMEKTKKNKIKDYERTKGKKWVNIPVLYKDRTTGSGVTFGGKYVDVD